MNTCNLGFRASSGFWDWELVRLEEVSETTVSAYQFGINGAKIKILILIYTFFLMSKIHSRSFYHNITCISIWVLKLGGKERSQWWQVRKCRISPKLLCATWEKAQEAERMRVNLRTWTSTGPKWGLEAINFQGQHSLPCFTEAVTKTLLFPNLWNPPLLSNSPLSANDLAFLLQKKCRELAYTLSISYKPTCTLTCNYGHPSHLLEGRGDSPVQTSPSHNC